MDPFLPAMVLTSLCIAATKVYRHLRPNDQQPPPIQAEQHDGDNLETADSTASGSQEASFSEATSSARTSSEESPGLCDEKDTDDNDSGPSPPLTALAPVTPPHSPPRMTRQYAFYKSIHHERSILPSCHELLTSDEEQVTQKDKNTNIPSQVTTKSDNQPHHGSTTSSAAAQRYHAKKPWLIPQSAASKTSSSTKYPIRAAVSHHPRQRHMISSSLKKIPDDKTASHSSTESDPVFSIPSSSQAPPPMTRQYAFYKSIHHERSILPSWYELLTSDEEQVTQKDKNTNIPSQVTPKSGNQPHHGSTTSSAAAQRYRAKKPWLIPQSAASKTSSSTKYPIRAAVSPHPRQRHMISSSLKKIPDDKTASHSSTESDPVFSIPSSSISSSQAPSPMTRQYAFCGSKDTSSSTTTSSTTSSSSTNATQNQERRTRLTSPELMPPPPPRPPRRHNRPLLRRQNAFFADTTPDHTMHVSKRKRHLMDENISPPSNSRTVRQRLNTDKA